MKSGFGRDVVDCGEAQIVVSAIFSASEFGLADVVDGISETHWGDVCCPNATSFFD